MISLIKSTFDLFEFGDYIAHKSGGWSKKEIHLSVRAQIQFSLEQIDLQQGYKQCRQRKETQTENITQNENKCWFLVLKMVFNEFGN